MEPSGVRYWKMLFMGACVVVGVLAAILAATWTGAAAGTTRERLAAAEGRYQRAQRQVQELTERTARLERELQAYEETGRTTKTRLSDLKQQIAQLRSLAGLTPMRGPGIVVQLTDSPVRTASAAEQNGYIVHDQDLLQLVNELYAAGAEAIAVNEQRIGPMTAIRCSGPVVQVNGEPIVAPYVIKAIGDAEVMEGALRLPLGVLETLSSFGITVAIKRDSNVLVPALALPPAFHLAVPELAGPRGDR